MYIASLARWDTQLKGLVEPGPDAVGAITKRKTRSTGWHGGEQEGHAVGSAQKYQEKMFEEFKELEKERAKEALELVQKKHMLTKCEGERERAQ